MSAAGLPVAALCIAVFLLVCAVLMGAPLWLLPAAGSVYCFTTLLVLAVLNRFRP